MWLVFLHWFWVVLTELVMVATMVLKRLVLVGVDSNASCWFCLHLFMVLFSPLVLVGFHSIGSG